MRGRRSNNETLNNEALVYFSKHDENFFSSYMPVEKNLFIEFAKEEEVRGRSRVGHRDRTSETINERETRYELEKSLELRRNLYRTVRY